MITLVFIRSRHVRDNVAIAIRPEDKPMYERFAAKHGYKIAVRKPKEPTCDNMTIRQTGSGNHRHCDLLNLYIPDNEMFPSCSYHSAVAKFERKFSGKARLQNTFRKKGGAA